MDSVVPSAKQSITDSIVLNDFKTKIKTLEDNMEAQSKRIDSLNEDLASFKNILKEIINVRSN